MTSTREQFQSFIRLLQENNVECLEAAHEKLNQNHDVARMFADQSPKFVEIFSVLNPGTAKSKVGVAHFRVISVLFDALSPELYFRCLQYLADMIIRKYIPDLYQIMDKKKKGDIAIHILVQTANVSIAHCRDLFFSLDLTNRALRSQASSEGRSDYIRLATLFLKNPDIAPQVLSTKYFIAAIWGGLDKDPKEVIKPFLEAMLVVIDSITQSAKLWVFNEKSLDQISHFPFDHKKREIPDEHCLVYQLLQKILSGPDSIILENPARTYCQEIVEPAPKNIHILNFIRKLNPWKKPSHRELVLFIFKQSPDLIGTFFSRLNRSTNPGVDLVSNTSLVFLSQAIELDWPQFLYQNESFFDEGRSVNLLFESILPSILTNSCIDQYMKKDCMILSHREIIVIFIKALQKFNKLPQYMKTSELYTRLRGRIPAVIDLINSAEGSRVLYPFTLKFLITLDEVFPYFFAETTKKIAENINNIGSFSILEQLLLLKTIPLLDKSLVKIPVLCKMILDEKLEQKFRSIALQQLNIVLQNSDIFNGYESEIPIWIGETLRNNAGNQLFELITNTKGNLFKYVQAGNLSPLCHALGPKSDKIAHAKSIIQLMSVHETSDLDLSPVGIMSQLKWYALESATVLLCSAIAQNSSDLDLTLNCLKIVVSFDPTRTLPYVFSNPFIQAAAFNGSNSLDEAISYFIEWNQSCDEEFASKFIQGVESDEVMDRIAPFIPQTMTRPLIKKLIRARHSIRKIIHSREKYDLSEKSDFWKWAFEGFEPINISLLWPKMLKSIEEEEIILDILRTIWITHDTTLLRDVTLPVTENERILVFIADMIPDQLLFQPNAGTSLPVCFLKRSPFNDPLSMFEATKYQWSYEYLLQEIKHSTFTKRSHRLSKDKVDFVTKFYLKSQSDVVLQTFQKIITKYLKNHPEVVDKPPSFKSQIFNEAGEYLLQTEVLSQLESSKFEGLVNILLGSEIKLTLRIVLFLATQLATSSSFYQLLEAQRISPSAFLFATGDVARTIIQSIHSDQKFFPKKLVNNANYLAPFHIAQQKFEIDQPFSRFLLHFANYLLVCDILPLNRFIECGACSVVLRSLSSKDDYTREVAYACLSEIYDMNMKKEWDNQNILKLFLEPLLSSVTTFNQRYTSLVTSFLASAIVILMKPGHGIYLKIVKWLVSSPTMRITTTPLFSDTFGQMTIDYKSQRNWILKMIRNGIQEQLDVELLKKSKVIERLCHYFASPLSEMATRRLILEIFEIAGKLDRLDGLVFWIQSVMCENFAVPLIDQLVLVSLNMKKANDIEKEARVLICRTAWSLYKQKLSEQTKDKVENILCSGEYQIPSL